ncbi:hypothetical protein C0J52_26436 [Blattella germanica]|nr:hypothetical protein C0J52_26436 [Blattella germanica]
MHSLLGQVRSQKSSTTMHACTSMAYVMALRQDKTELTDTFENFYMVRQTPLMDRANMPKAMASNGPGSPFVTLVFNQWREEKYSPTPGTQRLRHYDEIKSLPLHKMNRRNNKLLIAYHEVLVFNINGNGLRIKIRVYVVRDPVHVTMETHFEGIKPLGFVSLFKV